MNCIKAKIPWFYEGLSAEQTVYCTTNYTIFEEPFFLILPIHFKESEGPIVCSLQMIGLFF